MWLGLQAERDGLLLEGRQDKARIQSLLAFTQPVLHDLHYAKDTQPASVATQPLSERRLAELVSAFEGAPRVGRLVESIHRDLSA